MNALEIIAVFVGIPALIYGFIAACTLLPGRAKEKARRRIGETWDFAPQWWAGDTPVTVPAETVAASGRGGAHGAW